MQLNLIRKMIAQNTAAADAAEAHARRACPDTMARRSYENEAAEARTLAALWESIATEVMQACTCGGFRHADDCDARQANAELIAALTDDANGRDGRITPNYARRAPLGSIGAFAQDPELTRDPQLTGDVCNCSNPFCQV
jgi:hypothetical protein